MAKTVIRAARPRRTRTAPAALLTGLRSSTATRPSRPPKSFLTGQVTTAKTRSAEGGDSRDAAPEAAGRTLVANMDVVVVIRERERRTAEPEERDHLLRLQFGWEEKNGLDGLLRHAVRRLVAADRSPGDSGNVHCERGHMRGDNARTSEIAVPREEARDGRLPERHAQITNQHEDSDVDAVRCDVGPPPGVDVNALVSQDPPLQSRLRRLEPSHERTQPDCAVVPSERHHLIRESPIAFAQTEHGPARVNVGVEESQPICETFEWEGAGRNGSVATRTSRRSADSPPRRHS